MTKRKREKTLNDRLVQTRTIEAEKAKQEAYESLYLDILILKEKIKTDGISNDFLEKHLTQNSVEHKAAVLTELVFHQYLKRYTNYNRYKISLTKSCDIAVRHGEEILLLANKAERLNQFNLLIDFLKLGREKRLLLEGQPASKKFKSVLKLEDQAAFLTAAAEFIESIEGPKLSLHEAKQIKSLGQNHDNFIAPISQRDHRFIYTHNNYSLSQEKRKELEQLQETLSKEDFRIARQEARVEAENASKLRALKILEDQVRQYIEWARSQ